MRSSRDTGDGSVPLWTHTVNPGNVRPGADVASVVGREDSDHGTVNEEYETPKGEDRIKNGDIRCSRTSVVPGRG